MTAQEPMTDAEISIGKKFETCFDEKTKELNKDFKAQPEDIKNIELLFGTTNSNTWLRFHNDTAFNISKIDIRAIFKDLKEERFRLLGECKPYSDCTMFAETSLHLREDSLIYWMIVGAVGGEDEHEIFHKSLFDLATNDYKARWNLLYDFCRNESIINN
jgi:hypothetical protein